MVAMEAGVHYEHDIARSWLSPLANRQTIYYFHAISFTSESRKDQQSPEMTRTEKSNEERKVKHGEEEGG